ncbi:MAG: phtA, partial [Gammaproteobacteria bacterium]|nr:phtA [Gammaproteobacteria bacterium]
TRFALLAGTTQALGMLGAVIGDAPMAMIFNHFGWRQAMYGISAVFILLSALMFWLIPKEQVYNSNKPAIQPIKIWSSLAQVL